MGIEKLEDWKIEKLENSKIGMFQSSKVGKGLEVTSPKYDEPSAKYSEWVKGERDLIHQRPFASLRVTPP